MRFHNISLYGALLTLLGAPDAHSSPVANNDLDGNQYGVFAVHHEGKLQRRDCGGDYPLSCPQYDTCCPGSDSCCSSTICCVPNAACVNGGCVASIV